MRDSIGNGCVVAETDGERRTRLPSAVYDLAIRPGGKPEEDRDGVRLTQTGRMKASLKAKSWMALTATQSISTRACEFDWDTDRKDVVHFQGRIETRG